MFVFPCCLMPGTKGQRGKRWWHLERVCVCVCPLCAYSLRLIVLSVFSSSLSAQTLFPPDPPDHNLFFLSPPIPPSTISLSLFFF